MHKTASSASSARVVCAPDSSREPAMRNGAPGEEKEARRDRCRYAGLFPFFYFMRVDFFFLLFFCGHSYAQRCPAAVSFPIVRIRGTPWATSSLSATDARIMTTGFYFLPDFSPPRRFFGNGQGLCRFGEQEYLWMSRQRELSGKRIGDTISLRVKCRSQYEV